MNHKKLLVLALVFGVCFNIDCITVPNAVPVNIPPGISCFCNNGFTWRSDVRACAVDCSRVENSYGTNLNPSSCACLNNFGWSSAMNKCVAIASVAPISPQPSPNCGLIANAVRINPLNIQACDCITNYYWNGFSCLQVNPSPFPPVVSPPIVGPFPQINCSSIAYAIAQPGLSFSCQCISGFFWNVTSCYRNCSWISNSLGLTVNIVDCSCQQGYIWNGTACQIQQQIVMINPPGPIVRPPPIFRPPVPPIFNCNNIRRATGFGRRPNTCDCERGYRWDPDVKRCNFYIVI